MESREVVSYLFDKAYKNGRSPQEILKALEVFFTKEEVSEGIVECFRKSLKSVSNEL